MKKWKSLLGHFITSIKISYTASPIMAIIRVFFELISVAFPIILADITNKIINCIAYQVSDTKVQMYRFGLLLCVMITIQIINMLIKRANSLISIHHNDLVAHQIKLQIEKKIIELDISYFDNPKFYNQIQNANRDSQSLMNLTSLITGLIRGISQIISCGIILGKLNIIIPIIILFLNIPSGLIDKYIAKKKYDWQIKRTTNDRKIWYFQGILDGKQFAKDIRVFNTKKYFLNKFENQWQEWVKEKMKVDRSRILFSFLASMLPYLASIFVFIFVGLKILNGTLEIGNFTLYTGITSQFIGGIATLLSSINQGYESEMRLTNFSNFLKCKSFIDETGVLELKKIDTIEFNNVSFTYPNTNVEILKQISFKINKNEKIALVGLNGAGKTTLIKLLLHLYEPTSGIIFVNGIDIKKYNIDSLRKTIGVVFQNFNRYELSLKENIALADINNINNNFKIKEAMNNADLHLRQELKNGFDTYLGKIFDPDGIELSGGQWQKVAISQAYFKNSSFMILDEPNASLDPEAEQKLFLNMKDICKDKGAIFITHRLSSVSIADKIIVLDSGICKEIGTHNQLMDKKGIYYNLFTSQSNKYSILQNA